MVQGSSASINLYLKGWQERDAELCAGAIELTGAHNHGTLIRRYGIEGILDCWQSRYEEARRCATEGKRLARAIVRQQHPARADGTRSMTRRRQ